MAEPDRSPAVSEPGTMSLLASGLGAVFFVASAVSAKSVFKASGAGAPGASFASSRERISGFSASRSDRTWWRSAALTALSNSGRVSAECVFGLRDARVVSRPCGTLVP